MMTREDMKVRVDEAIQSTQAHKKETARCNRAVSRGYQNAPTVPKQPRQVYHANGLLETLAAIKDGQYLSLKGNRYLVNVDIYDENTKILTLTPAKEETKSKLLWLRPWRYLFKRKEKNLNAG